MNENNSTKWSESFNVECENNTNGEISRNYKYFIEVSN